MLALFIALLLLLGTNEVFRASSQTIQAGQALNTVVRNGRAVQPIFFNDLQNCAPDSPAFIISSCLVPQYLNAADAAANNATAGTPPAASGCLLSDHLHRCDMLMFFARGLYKRKTADSPYLASTTTSDEAYIHYGHLRTLANDGVTYIGPDDYAGIAEPYAANWVLGRNVILMADPTNILPNAKDLGGTKEDYSASVAVPPAPWNLWGVGSNPPLYPANVTPLGCWSADNNSTGFTVQSSRYDLAGATIDQMRGYITNAAFAQAQQANSAAPYYFWWAPLVYQQPHSSLDTGVAAPYPFTPLTSGYTATAPVPYNTSKIGGAAALAEWFPRNRFQGSSIPSPTPLTSTDQAGMAPFFQEHVSQFIVEFAGDFLSQNANGDVTDTVPDGQIDWVYATRGDWVPTNNYAIGDYVIYSGNYFQAIQNIPGAATNVAPTNASPWQTAIPPKQIRWYGMPRDSAGSGQVISSYHSGLMTANELNDVVPLADLWNLSAANKTRPLPYETETIPSLIAPSIATSATLLGTFNTSYNGDYNQAMTTPAQARYTAVWRNDVPAMVRILMKVDDPTNAVQDGPWFEYIFKLK